MRKKIKGLTENYEKSQSTIYNSLLLRLANDDVSFDIEKKINILLLGVEKSKAKLNDPQGLKANLIYFKYKFLSSPKNNYKDIEKAQAYLKEAFSLNSTDAIAQYGYDYYTGTGIATKVDKEKALQYFFEAKNSQSYSNYIEFLMGLALYKEYQETTSIETLKKATNLFEEALDKNIFEAKEYLAACYIDLQTNLDLAEKYLKQLDKYDVVAQNEINKVTRRKK